MASLKKIKVVYFQRKQRPVGNFSVEIYYELIRQNLPEKFEPVLVQMPYYSKGFIKRLANAIYCVFRQGDINHITGDIHYVAAFLNKKKTISTVLDCGMLRNIGKLKYSVFKYFWFTLPAKRSNYFAVISEATKKDLLNYINFPAEKIKVIYISVSSSFYRKDKDFNKSKPVILQLGTAENKNLKRLIPALKNIPCRLVIIGKIGEEIVSLLASNGIEYENVSQAITEEEIIRYYQSADILTLASTLEGFGMPIIEANITGRVVVTGNVTSMPEVAGNAAHLVDPFNVASIREGLLKVINDDNYRKSLIENGYLNAKRFDLQKIVADHVELYNNCLVK